VRISLMIDSKVEVKQEVQPEAKIEPKKPIPVYDHFFFTHPMGSNKKTILVNYTGDDGTEQQIKVQFTWQAMQCCYIHLTNPYDSKPMYVGTFDGFNHTIWETPSGLQTSSYWFKRVRHLVGAWRRNRLAEWYTVTIID
jgi:hypothetical protein